MSLRMLVTALILVQTGAMACQTTLLSDEGAGVRLSHLPPDAGCAPLGPIYLGPSINMERAQTQMLNNAAARGANYVHEVGVNHTAYRCPTEGATRLAH